MFLAVLIFLGQISIDHRNKVEYLVVISTIMFIWTFVYDFKRFKMDIDRIPKASSQPQPLIINQMNLPQQNYVGSWNNQGLNSF